MLATLKVHTVRVRVIVAAIGVGVVVGVAVAGGRAIVAAAVVVALYDHVDQQMHSRLQFGLCKW